MYIYNATVEHVTPITIHGLAIYLYHTIILFSLLKKLYFRLFFHLPLYVYQMKDVFM